MSNAPVYPSIPVPSNDIQSLVTTVRALKQVVEILVGLRGDRGVAGHIAFQDAPPNPTQPGDLWITSGGKTRVWNGTTWLAIVP